MQFFKQMLSYPISIVRVVSLLKARRSETVQEKMLLCDSISAEYSRPQQRKNQAVSHCLWDTTTVHSHDLFR